MFVVVAVVVVVEEEDGDEKELLDHKGTVPDPEPVPES